MDFVWTLLDFSMELTKVCVELVWKLCFGVEFVWILNFGFIPTFGVILGLIVDGFMLCFWNVLYRVCVASIRRILWSMDKGCSGMVSGQNWHVPELLRSSLARGCMEPMLLRGWAQNCSPRVRN